MNQKANLGEEGRAGRPVQFDQTAVIEAAVSLFWAQGFDGTSLDNLVASLGVSRSTLYNSFGGKEGLYIAARERYLEHLEHLVVEPLAAGTGGISDLLAFTDRLHSILTSEEMPAGCLVLNWMSSPRNTEAATRYLQTLSDAIAASLHRSAGLGEIAESTIASKTALVLTAVIGLNHAATSSMPPFGVTDLIEGLRDTIDEWSHRPAQL